MQNRVTVTIDGQEYTLVASEDAAYMKKVAAHVDEKLQEVRQGGKVSSTDAAVLAALNLELSEAKREIFKLQTQGKKG